MKAARVVASRKDQEHRDQRVDDHKREQTSPHGGREYGLPLPVGEQAQGGTDRGSYVENVADMGEVK